MDWRKRTKDEIDEAVSKGDFTGGYDWWPWFWHMRKWYLLGFAMNFLFGWIGGVSTAISEPSDPISYLFIAAFGVVIPILIGSFLRKDFKLGKRGISM